MHGTVVRVDKDEVLVDIGYKSEGVIPVAELTIRRSVNPADEVAVGEEIDALVLTKEDAEGRLILSKKRARFELAWKKIEAASESGEPVTGKVIEVVKGGLILDLGVRGFLPASLVDIRRVQDLDEFLGRELRCKVIELNRSRNNVVLSRRAVLEDERKEMRQAILDRLSPGDVIEGQISNIVDFGAFVDLDGMDGLIHISELSWSHVNHPSEVLDIGQTVKVKVLDIDRERQRISLGLKQTQTDPWQQVVDSYGEDDVVEGRVAKVVTFGAFVEILPGVEGLVHISELAHAPRREPARGRLAGPGGQRPHPRDRRRAPPAVALAEARRGGRPSPSRAPTAPSRCTRRPTSSSPRRPSRRVAPPGGGRRRGGGRGRRARGRRRQPEAEAEAEAMAEEPDEAGAPEAVADQPEAEAEAEAMAEEPDEAGAPEAVAEQPEAEPMVEESATDEPSEPPSRPKRPSRPRRRWRDPTGSCPTTRPIAVAITGGIGAGKTRRSSVPPSRRRDRLERRDRPSPPRTDPEVSGRSSSGSERTSSDEDGAPDRERIALASSRIARRSTSWRSCSTRSCRANTSPGESSSRSYRPHRGSASPRCRCSTRWGPRRASTRSSSSPRPRSSARLVVEAARTTAKPGFCRTRRRRSAVTSST